ncbi:uncharacterized protein A4U43_C08F26260 [Asparagus officinalis]|nr:uncharacterized protein A4U43_C08F26260 [Asparagus officinalis]
MPAHHRGRLRMHSRAAETAAPRPAAARPRSRSPAQPSTHRLHPPVGARQPRLPAHSRTAPAAQVRLAGHAAVGPSPAAALAQPTHPPQPSSAHKPRYRPARRATIPLDWPRPAMRHAATSSRPSAHAPPADHRPITYSRRTAATLAARSAVDPPHRPPTTDDTCQAPSPHSRRFGRLPTTSPATRW